MPDSYRSKKVMAGPALVIGTKTVEKKEGNIPLYRTRGE
jgi:hypothetical protein